LAAALDPDGDLGWKPAHPRYGTLITALFHVNTYEVEHQHPMVGAFAGKPSSRTSNAGFARLGRDLGRFTGHGEDAERQFRLEELGAAVQYWSAAAQADASPSDKQFDAIMAELSTIKRMRHQLLHA
jgi:hypothetical protein